MKEILIEEYNNLKNLRISPKEGGWIFNVNFIGGAFVEILGDKPGNFSVKFFDKEKNYKLVHETLINNNMWTRTNIKYYINYHIEITNLNTGEVQYYNYDAQNKKVYIHLDSDAIGDTLAWFPYVEEFRKKHNCKVVCSTFHNDWFESQYPELEFIKPGLPVEDLYAMYSLGWHYGGDKVDYNFNPQNFREYSLQECSADILGLDFKEIKPKLSFKNTGSTIDKKYVCIAPHASSHAKYWMYPNGWQEIINYLKGEGYEVVLITQESLGDEWHDSKINGTLNGVIDKTGNYPLEDRANDMMNAEFFIGVGSGLSWLNWALNKPTILISGFSSPISEFTDCERVFTPSLNICNSCFNKEKLNAGDWEWCPYHKNTDRHYECTKSILPSSIINCIERVKKP